MEVKNIIFAGDSFTWGEGCELFDDKIYNFVKSTCNEKGYYQPKYGDIQHFGYFEYIRNKFRFPTQVANHFNVMNILPQRNGGDMYGALNFVKGVLHDWNSNNFSHVIINLTEEYRSIVSNETREWYLKELQWDIVNYSEVANVMALWYSFLSMGDETLSISDDVVLNRYKEWNNTDDKNVLPSNNVLNLILNKFERPDDFEQKVLEIFWNDIKRIIENIELKKVKILILNSWCRKTVDFFKSDNVPNEELKDFFNSRFIKLYDDEKEYTDLYSLMLVPKYNLSLKHPWTKNQHPTKEAHDVIANSVIKKLEKSLL